MKKVYVEPVIELNEFEFENLMLLESNVNDFDDLPLGM